MLQTLLEGCQARVSMAASALEALDAIRREPPDLLISDIGMPERDGYWLITALRGLDAPVGEIPAIALTAYARVEDRTRVLMAGFQTHARKPVEPLELLAVIASLLRRRSKKDG
jgi:CheY-like chemotaxis protein